MRNWRTSLLISVLGAVLAVTAVGCTADDTPAPAKPPPDDSGAVFDEKRIVATLDGASVHLAIALKNPTASDITGQLALTLRDLDGKKVGSVTTPFAYGAGGQTLLIDLAGLPEGTTRPDLVKYALDYEVDWGTHYAKGTRSLFDALKKLEVILMTEDTFQTGKVAHFTLFALDPATAKPVEGADVKVSLTTATGEKIEVAAKTDALGNAKGELPLPEGAEGQGTLDVTVDGNGNVSTSQTAVKLVREQKILVTTDKPMYQPGQTIHLRALALRSGDKTPEAQKELVFELEDAKGNKLAKELTTTDEYGISSADITLGRDLNLGSWKVRAILGTTISEKSVTVDRYVLPKFKVTAALDQPWYAPGAAVTVTGEARYFFGKPVDGGKVHITGSTFDIAFTPFAELDVTTNAEGLFTATLTLPAYVVGQALDQGKGALKVDVSVTDAADHEQHTTRSAPVAKGAINVALVPESGELALGHANEIYVVTTDPIGGPVAAAVNVKSEGALVATLQTDAEGMGSFTLTPAAKETILEVEASAGADAVSVQRILNAGKDIAAVLLRTDKSVYNVGDTMAIEVRVAEVRDDVFVDIIHDGKTTDLRTIPVEAGKGGYALDVDASLEGEVIVSAFYLTDQGTMVRDQKVLFVQPADELQVTLTADKASYLPGESAKIDVHVQDRAGKGLPSAVGVQVVDEAVYALQEVQPGLLKVFFDLAKDLGSPKVSTGCSGCTPTDAIMATGDDAVTQQKARIAFAAIGDVAAHSVEHDTYKTEVTAMIAALKPYVDAERTRVSKELGDLAMVGVITWENLADYLETADLAGVDFWNNPYVMTADPATQQATFTSRGPDERAGTLDDVTFMLSYYEMMYGNRGWQGGPGGGDWADADGFDDGGPWAGGPAPAPPAEAGENSPTKSGGSAPIKVRDYFPETLFVNPAVITDTTGHAFIDVETADSITTWRMTGLASHKSGLLGSGTGGLVVFQDFFADIDFPVDITRNDAFSVPVAVYNYLETPQVVTLTVEAADWLEITGGSSKSITLQANEIAAVTFDIKATAVGVHGLTIVASGTTMGDAVKRTVEVKPDGKQFDETHSARFAVGTDPKAVVTDTVEKIVTIPEANIDGAQKLTVKVYPGFMSQVVEGMDSLLHLPGGCFEQTTSTAWPNVLAYTYMKKIGNIPADVELKAKGYISTGYQSLVTFECASGGFNWWVGDDPGNAILTAMGVMMFTDTKNIAFADDGLIARSAKWLADRQRTDGSWGEEMHLHAGNETLGAGSARATAYTAWALMHAGYEQGAVQKAIGYLKSAIGGEKDGYTLAMITIALAANDPSDPKLPALVSALHDLRKEDKDHTWWEAEATTMVNAWGGNAAIETTAVTALALMQAGAYPNDVQGALNYLIAHKDPQGNWGYSTQATVLTLKALIASLSSGAPETAATIRVKLNGEEVAVRTFDAFNSDVLWQVELADSALEGDNKVTLEYEGLGNLMWQMTATHFLPWTQVEPEVNGPLSIDVAYDKTKLTTDDTIHVQVTVSNSDPASIGAVMAELGLPPGFDLDASELAASQAQGAIQKFETTTTKLIVYLNGVVPDKPVTFGYSLKAKYPLEATAPKSEAYFYYNKGDKTESGPVVVQVQ